MFAKKLNGVLKSQQEKVPWVSIFEMNDKTIRLYNKQTSRFEVHCSSLDVNFLFFAFEHSDAVSALRKRPGLKFLRESHIVR